LARHVEPIISRARLIGRKYNSEPIFWTEGFRGLRQKRDRDFGPGAEVREAE
jgi:hypothetical protein